MINVESFIQSIGDKPLPPVEQWDPNYCGEMDLLIKADGSWLYNGTPLNRTKIKHLFSRVIKKEADQYFLVTPVEKVAIKVEWQPFTLVDYELIVINGKQVYQFVDNFDQTILLTELSQLELSEFSASIKSATPQQLLPIIQVRRNLFAGFSRNCYYRLLNEAQTTAQSDKNQVEITSNGLTFCLGYY